MLKLKDIFNIDISSKGGGKLYKKIMRKYNIPLKDIKEIKQEIVECSSGGGEGVKEYYYKILDDNQLDGLILQFCNIKRAICRFRLETGEEFVYKETAVWHYLNVNNISNPIAFVINDEEPIVIAQPNSSARLHASYLAKGNLIDRIVEYSSAVGQTIPKEQAQTILEPVIQEITKEEYESLITQ